MFHRIWHISEKDYYCTVMEASFSIIRLILPVEWETYKYINPDSGRVQPLKQVLPKTPQYCEMTKQNKSGSSNSVYSTKYSTLVFVLFLHIGHLVFLQCH